MFLQAATDSGGSGRLVPVTDQASGQAVRRYGCPVPRPEGGSPTAEPPPLRYRIPLADLKAGQPQTTVLFRGHRWTTDVVVAKPQDVVRIELLRPRPDTAGVTVGGEGKATGHLLFVFDCSGSMSKQNPQTGRRRIDTARESLETLLKALQDESKLAGSRYEVGLRAYGHRVRFTKGAPYCEKEPRDSEIHPDLDVQRLVPLGRLTTDQYDVVREKLRPLQPRGQTPLYYALKLAFDEHDFQGFGAEEPKNLIAITDGANFQTDCLTVQGQGTPTTKDDALRARKSAANGLYANTRIDVIGLSLNEELRALTQRIKQLELTKAEFKQLEAARAELRELELAKPELKQLATATGGDYYDADNDAGSLVGKLREFIRRVEFSVHDPAAEPPPGQRKLLGETWAVRGLPPRATPYAVRLHGASRLPDARPILLEGGESLRLDFLERENRLIYPPYDPQSWDPRDDKRGPPAKIQDPRGSGLYEVQAMLPRRSGQDVEFYVSVQHTDANEFTRRPAHVWAEIRPRGSARTYVFYDPDFVPDRPVPVFRFLATDWPRNCQQAEIQLWFKFDPASAAPDGTHDVNAAEAAEFLVTGLPDLKFEVRGEALPDQGYRVVVREHQPAGTTLPTARVGIVPPPARIAHRYYVGLHLAEHEFDYPRGTPAKVQVTARRRITDEALAVPPVAVLVPPL